MIKYKICIKKYKYVIYKILNNCNSLNYLKNWQYNIYIHRKEIYQYISKKYYIIYTKKKKKNIRIVRIYFLNTQLIIISIIII